MKTKKQKCKMCGNVAQEKQSEYISDLERMVSIYRTEAFLFFGIILLLMITIFIIIYANQTTQEYYKDQMINFCILADERYGIQYQLAIYKYLFEYNYTIKLPTGNLHDKEIYPCEQWVLNE